MTEKITPIKLMETEFRPSATCVTFHCPWGEGPSVSAREHAKNHVRATGHEVLIVVEKRSLWGPR